MIDIHHGARGRRRPSLAMVGRDIDLGPGSGERHDHRSTLRVCGRRRLGHARGIGSIGRNTVTPVVAIVDDDMSMLQSLGDLLESAGYMVRAFPSATSLLDAVDLGGIDCLVTDVGMPAVTDGLELRRIVHLHRPELPIILITGREVTEEILAIACQSQGLFRKPFNSQQLLGAVRDAIGRSGRPNDRSEA
jgi:CheY-like chemotaxis protein